MLQPPKQLVQEPSYYWNIP